MTELNKTFFEVSKKSLAVSQASNLGRPIKLIILLDFLLDFKQLMNLDGPRAMLSEGVVDRISLQKMKPCLLLSRVFISI